MSRIGSENPPPTIQVAPGFEDEWPSADALSTELVLNLASLADRIQRHGQTLLSDCGLPSSTGFNVLTIVLGAGEPLPPSAIAQRLVVSRQTITGILDSLERQGLARRISHSRDRRMTLIEVTAEGKRRAETLLPRLHAAEKEVMSCLTREEKRTLLGLVARLQQAIPSH